MREKLRHPGKRRKHFGAFLLPWGYVTRNFLRMRNDLPPILGVAEVQRLLKKSQATVLRLAREGEFVGRKLGDGKTASWAFTGESVSAYLRRIDRQKGDAA